MGESSILTLADAAQEMGVHYQTAYRWVRKGVLAAHKRAGMYGIERSDLDRVRRWRSAPQLPPQRRQIRSWGRLCDRLCRALVAGEDTKAEHLFQDLVNAGVHWTDICDRLMAPALRTIGEAWCRGDLEIAQERRATSICARILARWAPARAGRPRGIAVVCSPPSDQHQLPGQMAAAVLRDHRWRVHHLGVAVPADSICALVEAEAPQLVVISMAWEPALPEAESLVERLRGITPSVLLGRPGSMTAELVRRAQGCAS
ncbi:cobalamin-dependent protein [uncultured Mycobacterium sp.]|uniref:cobalamin-dependent protein n=1 Tax=uncultured Mycobacterium sp. TaxID=171292 RepID=UPI0035CA05B5